MERYQREWRPIEGEDGQPVGREAINPHEIEETTTIEVSKDLRDYLKQFSGRNYTERILTLDWMQNCSEADAGKEGGSCNKKASNAIWFHAGEDLFVAMPLCPEHLEACDIPNHDDYYRDPMEADDEQ